MSFGNIYGLVLRLSLMVWLKTKPGGVLLSIGVIRMEIDKLNRLF